MSLSSIAKHIRQSMRGFTVKNSPNPVLMLKPPHHQPLYEEKENVGIGNTKYISSQR